MSDYWPFLITGIASGTLYGLAGAGLVLSYRTSGVFNFAHGAVAAAAAYAFHELRTEQGLPWPVAALGAVLVFGLVVGFVLEVVVRRIIDAEPAVQIVATVGLLLLIQGALTLQYGATSINFRPFLTTDSFEVAGVVVGYDQLITSIVAVVLVAALYVFFRRSRLGLEMQAVVDNAELVALNGTPPRRVRRAAWVISSVFAGASGILLAAALSLDVGLLTLLVVQAFGAAAIGRFRSIGGTFAGGIAIGVGAAVITKYVPDHPSLAGLPSSLPFLVLFVVLVLTPARTLMVNRAPRRPVSVRQLRGSHRAIGAALAMVVVALLPSVVDTKLSVYTSGAITVITLASLALLVSLSGQVSLCHVAFLAIGATTFSHLTTGAGLPWVVALLLTGLVAVPVGAIVSIPAIRLSGVYLGLATFGFGILVERVVYGLSIMFSVTGTRSAPRPDLFSLDTDRGYFYLCAGIAAASLLVVATIARARLGRLLRALADSPTALACNGADSNITRVLVFCISAFLASIAGALTVAQTGTVSPSSFSSFGSLTLLAVLATCGRSVVGAPVVAAVLLVVVPTYITTPDITAYQQLTFGFFALAFACLQPLVRETIQRQLPDAIARRRTEPGPVAAAGPYDHDDGGAVMTTPSGFEVRGMTVRYGGVVAVDDVSLHAPRGQITGLIGPNGAGKSSLFAACSGLVRARVAGEVELDGVDISRMSTHRRCQRGLGRTFQRFELFESLTVTDNVRMGCEALLAGSRPWAHLFGNHREEVDIRDTVAGAAALCGIEALLPRPVSVLSAGQRRLVELARAIAGGAGVLLLDEPSSGLDPGETSRFGDTLVELVERRGIGILLVEHDMDLVMRVCSHVYVLDFGRLIFDGDPSVVQSHPGVRAAYLGSAA